MVLIQNRVYLDKDSHRYYDKESGREYISVSRVISCYEDKFDEEMISRNCAGRGKYIGMNQQQVKDSWNKKRVDAADHGTKIHEALERYTKESVIIEEDEGLRPMIESICLDYKEYKKTYDEVCLYHSDFLIAGTCDKILLTNARNGYVDIEDYKNFKDGVQFYNKYNKYMFEPVSHLSACNFVKTAIQLSMYGIMYEKITGNKIRQLWIREISTINPLNHKRINVPYLKTDCLAIMKDYYLKNSIVVKDSFEMRGQLLKFE